MIDPAIPAIIGTLTTAVIGVGGLVMQVIILLRQSETQRQIGQSADKLVVLHDMVDGQSEKLNKAIGGQAFSEGKAEGIKSERANPMVASSDPIS